MQYVICNIGRLTEEQLESLAEVLATKLKFLIWRRAGARLTRMVIDTSTSTVYVGHPLADLQQGYLSVYLPNTPV